ncbi:efflux RND transporter periplasmic adaptor subunit [bacterium]|nr:efflux RND transporter periplasmic adaptor subunit [bacterium]
MKKIITILIIGIAIAGPIFLLLKKGKTQPTYETFIAKKTTLTQEIEATGEVKAETVLDLAFERAGKIKKIYVKEGQTTKEGDILISLENDDLKAQLNQAKADLDFQEAKLKELERGAREEEIEISQQKVENAKNSLKDTEINLEKTKENAQSALEKLCQESLSLMENAVNVGQSALYALTDIQYAHFNSQDQESEEIAEAKRLAVSTLLGGENTGRWTNDYLAKLSGGVKGEIEKAKESQDQKAIELALKDVKEALEKVKAALEKIPLSKLTSAEKTNLSTEKTSVLSEALSLSTKIGQIELQKTTNQKNISQAESQVREAKNALTLAEKELALKKAGPTKEEIKAQKAQVERTKSNTNYLKTQIGKTKLLSPVSGLISRIEPEEGETVLANQIVVSIISQNKFKIEANIPETDISEVKARKEAKVTLDAFGENTVFLAKVVKIEPTAKIIEGIATYKTTLEFEEIKGKSLREKFNQIKPGMTANITILASKKENVLAIPRRALVSKDDKKSVRILQDGKIKEFEVSVGLRSSDGLIEIKKGLKEGDEVLVSEIEKKKKGFFFH